MSSAYEQLKSMIETVARALSFQGSLTDDNRDYCGISERPDATLYTVIDGSTRGPNGGNLARELACPWRIPIHTAIGV
jgi:hypothetical protein